MCIHIISISLHIIHIYSAIQCHIDIDILLRNGES